MIARDMRIREDFIVDISRARLIICTIFGENQIFRVLRQKRRNRHVIKCHVNNKVTHTCFQLVKTGKEQFQMKVSRQALSACVSLALFSLVSVGVLSTCVNTESATDPANYALFPDRRSYFYQSLHNHLIHGDHCESYKYTPTSKMYVYYYTIDVRFFFISVLY